MRSYLAFSARSPRRRKPARLLLLAGVPLLLVVALAMAVASGGAATATAACQVLADGTTATGTTTATTGAVGALTPLQVEQYWVAAGGPMSGAVTAASLAYAESADITDRIQGSSVSTPSTAGPGTPTDPSLVGYGLWQITPGSTADYDPAVNAKIAVQKYRGSLAAGGGGWSPWTTYGTAAYYAAIPAAQAAYAKLTAQGAGKVTAAATAAANPLTGQAAAATSAAASGTQIGTTGADHYIAGLSGRNDAQYAIVKPDGTVLAQHEDGTSVAAGQLVDGMLLVAYLRAHPAGDPAGAAASHLKAMVERSNATAAAWVYAQVGDAAVTRVASLAHMTAFHLGTGAHALDRATATAKDFALLLANIDTLMPSAARAYGMGLLAHVSSDGQWGLLDAGIPTVNGSVAGGVMGGDTTWTVGQAAQVKSEQAGVVGIAVTTTKNASRSDGQDVIQTVGIDLLGTTRNTLGSGLDLSGLSASDRSALNAAASEMQSAGATSACPCPSSDTAAGSPVTSPVPGGTAGAGEFAAPLKLEQGRWYEVGATQYGGPSDPSSSDYGSIGGSEGYLPSHPDSFAELSVLDSNPANGGNFTFQDGNALNNLPYMTGLRVSSGGAQKILYKRDIGYGQGPGQTIANGQPYRLDIWWQSAQGLHVSKNPVKIELAPASGTSGTLGQDPGPAPSASPCPTGTADLGGVQITPGQTAQILPDGTASAPQDAPAAVKRAIAAANKIHTATYIAQRPEPLNTLMTWYDCSASTAYVLYNSGLNGPGVTVGGVDAGDSTTLEGYGDPGPGKWISIYANSDHAFIVIAGRAFDTADFGGPNLPAGSGPRWRSNPLGNLQDGASYVVRHPPGL